MLNYDVKLDKNSAFAKAEWHKLHCLSGVLGFEICLLGFE